MPDSIHITVLIVAFVLDCFFGDPRYPLHPVRLIGWSIKGLKMFLFEYELNGRFSGFLLTTLLLLLYINIYIFLRTALEHYRPEVIIILDIYIVWSAIALKDLVKHALPVADSLEQDDTAEARKRVNMMVGRDCSNLDKHAVSRATIESVTENFVDGFFAPVFWFVAATFLYPYTLLSPTVTAVLAVIVYRIVNTMDAMIGYKNDEYRKFGAFAARLDDVLTFIPARLSPLVLTPAAWICRLNSKQAWKIFLRDRKKHDSPNSAHTESFAAGALDLKLGGPTIYPSGTVEKPWLGDGSPDATPEQIVKTCKFITVAGWIAVLTAIAILELTSR